MTGREVSFTSIWKFFAVKCNIKSTFLISAFGSQNRGSEYHILLSGISWNNWSTCADTDFDKCIQKTFVGSFFCYDNFGSWRTDSEGFLINNICAVALRKSQQTSSFSNELANRVIHGWKFLFIFCHNISNVHNFIMVQVISTFGNAPCFGFP